MWFLLAGSIVEWNRQPLSIIISVSEIIACAGYSRGSFYKYFENKYDLMKQIIVEEAEHYTEILCGNIIQGETAEINSDYTYQITLETFQNVLNKKTLYCFILNAVIFDCNIDFFCRTVTRLFLKEAEIRRKTAPITQNLQNIYYYCNTRLYMSYIQFWAEQDFSISPEVMAKQIAEFSKEQKADMMMHRKKYTYFSTTIPLKIQKRVFQKDRSCPLICWVLNRYVDF